MPLLALSALEGSLINHQLELPFILDFKTHVRCLLILPLLIVADPLIDPLISSNLQSIVASGLIRDEHRDTYWNAIKQFKRRKDSYFADLVVFLTSILVVSSFMISLDDMEISHFYKEWVITRTQSGASLTWAGWWFVLISTPALLVLLFRWLWRFYLWGEFLFLISRMPLSLQPTHPDLSGGLGSLKNGESSFLVIFVAFGAMLSTSLAEEILFGDLTLVTAYPIITIYIALAIIIITMPMMFFLWPLIQAKRYGRIVYGSLGYLLSKAFDKKWGDVGDNTRGEELLKTADASSVCDYSDVYDAVRDMRYLPITFRDFIFQGIVLCLPFMPLVFTEVRVTEFLSLLFSTLM